MVVGGGFGPEGDLCQGMGRDPAWWGGVGSGLATKHCEQYLGERGAEIVNLGIATRNSNCGWKNGKACIIAVETQFTVLGRSEWIKAMCRFSLRERLLFHCLEGLKWPFPHCLPCLTFYGVKSGCHTPATKVCYFLSAGNVVQSAEFVWGEEHCRQCVGVDFRLVDNISHQRTLHKSGMFAAHCKDCWHRE